MSCALRHPPRLSATEGDYFKACEHEVPFLCTLVWKKERGPCLLWA